jgi:hypothetical protein
LVPLTKGISHAYVFSRHELYGNYWDTQAINIASVAARILRPEWFAVAVSLTAVLLFGFRFLRHQYRRLRRLDPRIDGLITYAIVWGIIGVAFPILLPAVPVMLVIGTTALLLDVTIRV